MITYRSVVFFLISSIVLGLLDQLQILWRLYLKELQGLSLLVLCTNLSLMEFQVKYLALFLLSSVIYRFLFFVSNVYKNIQLILEFFKAPFLVPHFTYYTLINFLVMLFAILILMLMISMLKIPLIRHIICGNS